jgi:hypothetical protein
MSLNGLGKYYSQFHISIVVRRTFFDFQNLITLFISEKMRIVGTSSNGGSQESVFYSNYNRSRSQNVNDSPYPNHINHDKLNKTFGYVIMF